jgi:hypothetical protein
MPNTEADWPTNGEFLKDLKWAEPAEHVKPQVSLAELLMGLQLLAKDEARAQAASETRWDAPTAGSVQVIKSGVLAITKWWTKACAGVGGITGLLAVIAGAITSVTTSIGEPITIALIGGGSLILAATAIAIALFVRADLDARGRATAARHIARAEVTAAFLQATSALPDASTSTSPSGDGRLAQLMAIETELARLSAGAR